MHSEATPVDLAHLERYTGGDVALNREVLELFCGQAQDLITGLQRADREGDVQSWRAHAHALKGGARGIGAFHLGELAAALEQEGPQGPAVTQGLGDLAAEMQRVADFVAVYRRA